jgi:hypothetical protein
MGTTRKEPVSQNTLSQTLKTVIWLYLSAQIWSLKYYGKDVDVTWKLKE